MNKLILKRIIEIMLAITVFSFMVGCVKKPQENTPHIDSGTYTYIVSEIYDDCMAKNDVQGAKEALETKNYLSAFCCNVVNYEDVKNRNYNNIQYEIGELRIAVAAYNEYNEDSAMDVEAEWICKFNSCSQEQHDAIEAYVEWFHGAQNGNYEGTIQGYTDLFYDSYEEIQNQYGITNPPSMYDLTPAQLEDVEKRLKDPNHVLDKDLWN